MMQTCNLGSPHRRAPWQVVGKMIFLLSALLGCGVFGFNASAREADDVCLPGLLMQEQHCGSGMLQKQAEVRSLSATPREHLGSMDEDRRRQHRILDVQVESFSADEPVGMLQKPFIGSIARLVDENFLAAPLEAAEHRNLTTGDANQTAEDANQTANEKEKEAERKRLKAEQKLKEAREKRVVHPFWVFEWEGDVTEDSQCVFLCCLALMCSGALCAVAGIGGNIIQVTVLMAVGGISPRDAVPLSKVAIFAGSVASLITHACWSRFGAHAEDREPLISWPCCQLAVPSCLFGTVIGIALNEHIPNATLIALLTVFLLAITVWTSWQAYLQCLEYGQRREHHVESSAVSSTCTQKKAVEMPTGFDLTVILGLLAIVVSSGILRQLLEKCHNQGWWQLDAFYNSTGQSHCAHPVLRIAFWGKVQGLLATHDALHSILQVLCLLVPTTACLGYGELAVRKVSATDLMPLCHIRTIQVLLFVLGVMGSLTGVGGGVVLAPFFIMLGLSPTTTVATSTTCIIFISASSAIQYIITNRVKMALTLVYSCVNIVASIFGASSMRLIAVTWSKSYLVMVVISIACAASFLISLQKLSSFA